MCLPFIVHKGFILSTSRIAPSFFFICSIPYQLIITIKLTYLSIKNDPIPVILIPVSHTWCSDRVTVFTILVVISDFQGMISIEVFINADVNTIFFPTRATQGPCFSSETVFVLGIAGHIAVSRNEVVQRLIIALCSRNADCIIVLMPRAGRHINCSSRIITTFSSDDVNDTTRRICAIYGCTRSFNHFNFIDIFHIGDLIQVHPCGFCPTCTIISYTCTCRIIYTTTIDTNNNASIPVNGYAIVIEFVSIFPAAIPRVLERNARNTLNRFRQIRIVTLLDLFSRDDLHITAGTIVRLLGNGIAEFILCLICLDDNGIERIHI